MSEGVSQFEAICEGENLRRAWLDVWSGRSADARHAGAGLDGVTVAQWADDWDRRLRNLQIDLLTGEYRPAGLLWFDIPRGGPGGGTRRLGIPTVTDRVAQRAAKNVLEPLWEPRFLSCSHGFRPGRSVFTAVAHVLWHEGCGRRWVVDGDIETCFDSLDHARLLRQIAAAGDPRVAELVECWLATAAGPGAERGIAQGAPLSPLLANIYLHPFDVALVGGGHALVRYADDFVILCKTRRQAEAALEAAAGALASIGLRLNAAKTGLLPFGPDFTFLGARFCEEDA
jgi:group II intron reverse transcriptase/maturase